MGSPPGGEFYHQVARMENERIGIKAIQSWEGSGEFFLMWNFASPTGGEVQAAEKRNKLGHFLVVVQPIYRLTAIDYADGSRVLFSTA